MLVVLHILLATYLPLADLMDLRPGTPVGRLPIPLIKSLTAPNRPGQKHSGYG